MKLVTEFKEFALRGSVLDLAVAVVIGAAAKAAGAATLNYGLFTNAVVQFLLVAFVVFLAVRQINRWTRKPAEVVTPTMS